MLVLFCVFLSLSLFLYLNENPLCPITLFILGHFLLLTPLLLMYDFVMIKPVGTFQRTSHDEAFIRNTKSSYRIFSILTFSLSSTVRVVSHCVASRSPVPPWSYRSYTLICTNSIFQYLIFSLAYEVCAL